MAAVLPQGAMELMIALQTPSGDGRLGVPVLLESPPGQGKSSFVESLATPGFPVEVLIGSLLEPTDIAGLPVWVDGKVAMVPPEWAFRFEQTRQGILFLDELSAAPLAVQAAMLKVILGQVGTHRLPPGVRIVAAMNPPVETLATFELSPPICNRFLHLKFSISGEAFAEALVDGFAEPALPVIDGVRHAEAMQHWRAIVAAFLGRDPQSANTSPVDGEHAFASPRTWYSFAIPLMASADVLGQAPRLGGRANPVFVNLVKGSIGSGATNALLGFLKSLELPDVDKLLDNRESLSLEAMQKLRDDELHVLFTGLANSLLKRRESKKRGTLLDSTLTTLRLASHANQLHRIDAVFLPLRNLARSQTLQQVALDAHQQGRLEELQSELRKVFTDSPLAELSQLMQQKVSQPFPISEL